LESVLINKTIIAKSVIEIISRKLNSCWHIKPRPFFETLDGNSGRDCYTIVNYWSFKCTALKFYLSSLHVLKI